MTNHAKLLSEGFNALEAHSKMTEAFFFGADKHSPSNDISCLKKAYSDDLHEPTIGSLSVGSKPPEVSTDWLDDRHCQDTQKIECLRYDLKESERKRKLEAESSDTWRNKYRAADEELSKAKVKHDVEVRNLQYEITLLNKALEAHVGDEQLLLLTMKKAVSFAERVAAE